MRTNTLPPGDVGLVGLVAQQVLLQLIQFQPDQAPVGDGAAQLWVLDGLFESGLVGFEEGFAALLREEDALAFATTAEVLGLQGAAVHEREDDAVDDYGF